MGATVGASVGDVGATVGATVGADVAAAMGRSARLTRMAATRVRGAMAGSKKIWACLPETCDKQVGRGSLCMQVPGALDDRAASCNRPLPIVGHRLQHFWCQLQVVGVRRLDISLQIGGIQVDRLDR